MIEVEMVEVVQCPDGLRGDLVQLVLGEHQVAEGVGLAREAVGPQGLEVAVVDVEVVDLHPQENLVLQLRDVRIADVEVPDVALVLQRVKKERGLRSFLRLI